MRRMEPVDGGLDAGRPGGLAPGRRVASPAPAGAAACDHHLGRRAATGRNWTDNTNWVGDIGVPGAWDVVCITTPDHVAIDGLQATVAEVQLGGSAELEVKNGAVAPRRRHRLGVGPNTNVAINNAGSLGGTGTIRVQGGIFFASPNTGSVLTSGAGGNGHMVVEGHALVVDNGLGVEDGYQLDVAAGGSLRLAANTWMAAEPGTTTTINAGGTLELNGDGGFYQGASAGRHGSAGQQRRCCKTAGGTGTSVVDADYSRAADRSSWTSRRPSPFPTAGWSARSVSPGHALATGRVRRPSTTRSACQPTQDPAVDPMSVKLTVPGANARPPPCRSRSWPGRRRRRPQRRRQRGAGPRRQPRRRHRQPGDDHAALLAGRRDGHAARRGPGRAHRATTAAGDCCPTASTATLPSGLWTASSGR